MTTQVTWTIDNMESKAGTGEVLVVHWRARAEDGDDTLSVYGSVVMDEVSPEAPWFVPFEDLTKEVVLGWVWGKMDKQGIEDALKDDIATLKAPAIVQGLPW